MILTFTCSLNTVTSMCPNNSYGSNSAICASCPANSTSSAGSQTVQDCKCNPDFTGRDGEMCTQCASGEYKEFSGQQANISSCKISGIMFGIHIGADVHCTGYFHTTIKDFIVFVSKGGTYYKMTGASVSDVIKTATPDSPSDRWTVISTPFVLDETSVSAMWDGNFLSTTSFSNNNKGYELKNINMNCCRKCPAGTFKLGVGSGVCTACPLNTNSLVGSTIITDCQCNAGYQGADGGSCQPCAAGSFKLGLGSTCSDCPAGTYGTQSDAPCVDCPHGKYNRVPVCLMRAWEILPRLARKRTGGVN